MLSGSGRSAPHPRGQHGGEGRTVLADFIHRQVRSGTTRATKAPRWAILSPPVAALLAVMLALGLWSCGDASPPPDATDDAAMDGARDSTVHRDADPSDGSTTDSSVGDGSLADGSIGDSAPADAADAAADGSPIDAGPDPDCFVSRVLGRSNIPYGLGVGPDGSVAVVHWSSGGYLSVSTNAGGAPWSTPFRSDSIVSLGWAGVALNALGHVHVTFVRSHATNASGAWTSEARGVSETQALTTGPDGTVHRVGLGAPGLIHAALGPSTWTETSIASHGADSLAIAIDAAGEPIVAAIADDDGDGTYDLVLIRRDSTGTWTREVVPVSASRGFGVRLAMDAGDTAHVLHTTPAGRLVLTRHGTTTRTDDLAPNMRDFDVEVDADGTVHAAWGRFTIGVWHAALVSDAWVRTQVEDSFLEGRLELSRGPAGEILLSYLGQYERMRQVRQTRVCR